MAYFLTQVWNYKECHGAMYLDKHAQVNAVTSNLKGNAAGWLVFLHNQGAPELQDLGAFMQVL